MSPITTISEIGKHDGQSVTIRGWLYNLRESGKLLAVGLISGAALTLALARTARSLLYGLQPTDALTLLTAVAALAIVAFAATYLPARRAAALDPLDTLRAE